MGTATAAAAALSMLLLLLLVVAESADEAAAACVISDVGPLRAVALARGGEGGHDRCGGEEGGEVGR